MLINLKDMTDGMGIIFIRKFMETADQISCHRDELLFKEGDAADSFFTLIQGEFKLTFGATLQSVFTVQHPGDMIDWSSLVDRSTYSSTAVCTKLSEVFRFDREKLLNLLYRNPDNGLFFFKRLTEIIGKRLLE